MESSPRPRLSIVVPIYNEEENLPLLHGEIVAALAVLGEPAEVVYVDDRSTDGSLRVMQELRRQDSRVRIVRFRRNYGQTAALAAGFDASHGEIVVTLDGDLQNDPADIPALVAKVREGYDVVAGWRRKRHDSFVVRRLPSLAANRLIAWVTGVPIHDTGCTLKAFRGEVVKRLPIYAEQHRFLPVMSRGSGARVTEMVVNHRARRFGHSKYGLGRMLRVALDLLTIKMISQFSQRPLHYFGLLALGFMTLLLFFTCLALLSLSRGADSITTWQGKEWLSMVVSILMLGSSLVLYFAMLGLLAELAVSASGMHRRSTLNRLLNELH
jgi:glycosyltransferase involved in cell wall biosynthesis